MKIEITMHALQKNMTRKSGEYEDKPEEYYYPTEM
jgi:hypothetical protein